MPRDADQLNQLYDELKISDVLQEYRGRDKGVLYDLIHKTFLSQEPITAAEICKKFNIHQNMSLKQDITVSELASKLADFACFLYLLDEEKKHRTPRSLESLSKRMKSILSSLKSYFPILFLQTSDTDFSNLPGTSEQSNDDLILKVIIIALIIIGFFVTYNYLRRREEQVTYQESDRDREAVASSKSVSVSLSLILQATDQVTSLVETSEIRADILKSLIDNASYFICEYQEEADRTQHQLRLTNEPVVTSPSREVYLRIDIDDGQDLKGKTSRYILKRDLNPGQVGRLEKKAYLETLNGLERFNRV